MTFVAPAMLVWAGLTAIPVVIHLLFRPKPRNRPFPTLQFLRKALKRSSAILKVKHWLLLLLRVAVVLLLVLMLARPKVVLRCLPGGAGESAVALLLDDSFPMSFRRGDETRLLRAQAAARQILEVYPAGTEVALFTSSGAERTGFLVNLPALKESVAALTPAPYAGNMVETLSLALAALQERTRPNKELFVLTDMTRRAWRGTLAEYCRKAPAQVRVHLVDIGSEDEENRYIPELRLAPAQPRANQPLELSVTLAGLGHGSAVVDLYLDGERREERQAAAGADGTAVCLFTLPGLSAGSHGGWVGLSGPDTIAADNVRYFAVNVARRAEVLVVNGDPNSDPRRDGCLYLLAALAPPGLGNRQAVNATQIPGTALRNVELRSYDAVLLANEGRLTANDWGLLRKYVALGGALAVFGGPHVRPESYAPAVTGGVLPVEITGIAPPAAPPGVPLLVPDFNQPLVSAFAGGRNGDLLAPRFRQWVKSKPRDGPGISTLASFENGDPAIVRSLSGRGQVLFLAFSCAADWTDLPKLPCYLPLLHGIVNLLSNQRSGRYEARVREELVLPLGVRAESPKAALFGPGDKDPAPREVAVDAASGQCVIAGLEQPGNYHLVYPFGGSANEAKPGGESAPAARIAFAVNLDGTASVLQRISEAELQAALAPLELNFVGADGRFSRRVAELREEGREIAPYLALALLALLAAEALLANRFYK
ncbi:MAG: BatA and WFA domain-containing protein [Planctomycetota bacterium]